MVVKKTITIRDDQSEWLRKNRIILSKIVQDKIDELIEKGNFRQDQPKTGGEPQ